MNYEELKSANEWVSSINQSYINLMGPVVTVFKLDKTQTRINPLYNEEIGGRIYLRPFEIHTLHATNPFDWMFENTLAVESEQVKSFNFNFNEMVQTISRLKKSSLCEIEIFPIQDEIVGFEKTDNKFVVYHNKCNFIEYDLDEYKTITELAEELKNLPFIEKIVFTGIDDFSKCIRNFPFVDATNTSLLLKTFNKEYKNCSDVIEQGDLILVTDQMRLYEVASTQPTGNYAWKYQMWNCKCSTSLPYVEYGRLKNYTYGLKNKRINFE